MAMTVQEPRDTALHFFAREGQIIARWVLTGFAIVTVLTMVVMPPWAIVPAMLLVLTYLALLVANALEARSSRPGRAGSEGTSLAAAEDPGAGAHEREKPAAIPEWKRPLMAWPLLRHETFMVGAGVLVVLILAAALASILFSKLGAPIVVLAAFFLAAYIALLTSPVWFAALEDDIEAETQRESGTGAGEGSA